MAEASGAGFYAVTAGAAVLCATLAGALTGAIRRYAVRNSVIDTPNLRSSHSVPTPRGGGIAIVGIVGAAMAVGAGIGLVDVRQALTIGVGMVVLGWIGWRDDTGGLPPRLRLFIHFAIAIWTVAMLGGLPSLRTGVGSWSFGPAGYGAAVLGIVWSINLFNFMDGIDGLAGSQSVLIFGALALLLSAVGARSLALIAAATAGSSIGFLAWNWPPAKIFLGDVGSGPLGYLIAALAVASENRGAVPLVIFALIGGVFVVDATVTLARRLVHRHSPAEAHRDHAYQRLTRVWQSHGKVTLASGAATVALSLAGALALRQPLLLLPALGVGWGLLAVGMYAVERRMPMSKPNRP